MKATFRKALTGAGAVALAGGVLVATGGSAFASLPSALTTDPGATLGGIDFFNAAGVQITSGSIGTTATTPPTGAPFAAFAVAQDVDPGVTKINENAYTPVPGASNPPATWSGEQLANQTTFPVATPADLHGIANPVFTGGTGNKTLATYISEVPNTDTSTTDGYAGIYVIRIADASGNYAKAEILIDPTAGTWTQENGTFQLDGTTTTFTSPSSGGTSQPGASVALSVTVADSTTPATIPTGTVTFYDGAAVPANQISTPQPVSGTGTASVSDSSLALGAHTLTAVYTPTSSSSGFLTSTASEPYTIASIDSSNTALMVNPTSGPAFSSVDLSATVTDTTSPATITLPPTGSVKFLDGTTSIGTVAVNGSGVAEIPSYSGFAQGTHHITAVFTPTAGELIGGSTSSDVDFVASAPACPNGEAPTLCSDPQTVEATVAAGTITITSPYSPSNPLNLGTFVLNSSGTLLSASGAFGNTTNTASEIFVTDTRAGDPNWTASVQSGNFTNTVDPSTPIDGQNAGLIGVTVVPVAGNALTSSNVTVTNNPSGVAPITAGGTKGIGGAKHTFAQTTAGGDGSVGFVGTFTLNAPTSTVAGLYTGTVTFTVG
jgi:hypothetical protein